MTNSRRLCCLLVCLHAAALGCSPPTVDAAGAAPAAEAVKVPIVQPKRANWQKSTVQPATVHSYFEASRYARATGYVIELRADIGQRVKAGDVLAIVDVPEMIKQRQVKLAMIERLQAEERKAESQIAVARAGVASQQAKLEQAKAQLQGTEAELTASRSELERIRSLVADKAVAERLLDESQKKFDSAAAAKHAVAAQVQSVEAELSLSKAQTKAAEAEAAVAQALTQVARRELAELDESIKFAEVRAPFNGVVTARNVNPGDLVRSSQQNGDPLFVVSQLDRVRVRVMVPERDAPFVNVGDKASVKLQALPGQDITAEVSRIAGNLDEKTRTMLIEIDVPNPDGHLLPGMFGQADIELESRQDRLMLDSQSVRYDEKGKSYVYVVNASNQVQVVDVTTGLDDGRRIEILSGLSGGERVVGAVLQRLKPGQLVQVE